MENLRPFLNVNHATQIYRHNRRNCLMMTYSRGGKEQVLRPSGLNVLIQDPWMCDSKLLNQYWFNSRFISVNSILTVVTALFISLISPTSVLFSLFALVEGNQSPQPRKRSPYRRVYLHIKEVLQNLCGTVINYVVCHFWFFPSAEAGTLSS